MSNRIPSVIVLNNPFSNSTSGFKFKLKTEELVLEKECLKSFSRVVHEVLNGKNSDLCKYDAKSGVLTWNFTPKPPHDKKFISVMKKLLNDLCYHHPVGFEPSECPAAFIAVQKLDLVNKESFLQSLETNMVLIAASPDPKVQAEILDNCKGLEEYLPKELTSFFRAVPERHSVLGMIPDDQVAAVPNNAFDGLSLVDPLIKLLFDFCQMKPRQLEQQNVIIDAARSLFDAASGLQAPQNDGERVALIQKRDMVVRCVKAITAFFERDPNPEADSIENKLLSVAVVPNVNTHTVALLPVLEKQDEFLTCRDDYAVISCPSWSGSVRCLPFFFAIRSIMEGMQHPFFVLTQPSAYAANEMLNEFRRTLGDSVTFVGSMNELHQCYTSKNRPSKLVVAVLSEMDALALARDASKRESGILERTRFCLDKVEEHSVEMDVLIAELSHQTKQRKLGIPLHVMMICAENDAHVQRSFVKTKAICVDDYIPFEVEDKSITVSKRAEVDEIAVEEMYGVIKRMTNGEIAPGHMLVFTSGMKSMMKMKEKLAKTIELHQVENATGRPLRAIDVTSANVTAVQNRLDSDFKESNILLILPILCYGVMSDKLRDFIQKPSISNAIKVVFASNAEESSIFVDHLAVVIDCGLSNQPFYDDKTGILRVSEGVASIQSQNLRRSRAGRSRNAVLINFSQKGQRNPDVRNPPAILTTDISSLILSLREIGIKLEDAGYLDDASRNRVLPVLEDLKKINCIDKNGAVTEHGKRVQQLGQLPAFVSNAIVNVVKKEKDPNLFMILGAACANVFNSDSIVLDEFTEALRHNYCEDSDVTTILSTAFEIGKESEEEWANLSVKDGLNREWLLNLLESTEKLAHSLGDERDDLFGVLYSNVKDEEKRKVFNEFVYKLLNEIGNSKRDWLNYRKATFDSIENIAQECHIIFKGHESLAFEESSLVTVRPRPGSHSLCVPKGAYIMSLLHDDSTQTNRGSIIIRDKTVEDFYPRPICVKAPELFRNCFADALLKASLASDSEARGYFKMMSSEQGKNCDEFFHRMTTDEESFFTVIPVKDGAEEQLNTKAIQVESIIHYTASSVIAYYQPLNCVTVVSTVGPDRFSHDIIFLDNTKYKPYPMNAKVIAYLAQNKEKLNHPDQKYLISVTSSFLSFPFEQRTVFFSEKARIVANDGDYVFSDKQEMRLVLLTTEAIPDVSSLKGWKVNEVLSTEDRYAKAMSSGTEGLLSEKRLGNAEFFFPGNPAFTVPPPALPPEVDIPERDTHPVDAHTHQYCIMHDGDHGLSRPIVGASLRTKSNIGLANVIKTALKIQSNSKKDDIMKFLKELVKNPKNIETALKEVEEFEGLRAKWLTADKKDKEREREIRKNNPLTALHDPILLRQLQLDGQLSQLANNVSSFDGIQATVADSLFQTKGPDEIVPDLAVLTNGDDEKDEDAKKLDTTVKKFVKCKSEVVPVYLLTFNHLTDIDVSPEVFTQKINDLLKRFGCFVFDISPYQQRSHQNVIGSITVKTLSNYFIWHIKLELKALFQKKKLIRLKPQQDCVDPFLVRHAAFTEPFKLWQRKHALRLFKLNGGWFGTDEQVRNAERLIVEDCEKNQFPFHKFDVPDEVDMNTLSKQIKLRQNTGQGIWILNRPDCILSVSANITADAVNTLLETVGGEVGEEEDPDLLGEVLACGIDALPSACKVDVYSSTTEGYCRRFCAVCVRAYLAAACKFYDEANDFCDVDSLFKKRKMVMPLTICGDHALEDGSGGVWPFVPLGQVMWALVQENSMANLARSWMTGQHVSALLSSSQIKACPDHYTEFVSIKSSIPGTTKIKCSHAGCPYFFCRECCTWHLVDAECARRRPSGSRVCPNCARLVMKSGGCNRISCECGKHFCYFCGGGPFNTDRECYNHLTEKHNGYYSEPPDYRRFVLGQDVSDKDLEDFYKQYPTLRIEDKKKEGEK